MVVCVPFISVVGEHSDFKFGVQVKDSNSQPMHIKVSMKGAWSRQVTHFTLLVLKYLWNA